MMSSRESPNERLRIEAAGPEALHGAVAATRRFALDQRLGERDRAHLCIIVEELVANLFDHGGGDGNQRWVVVELVRRPSSIVISVEDDGPAFDVRTADFDREVPQRGGGAGLRLVRAWTKVLAHDCVDGRNRLDLEMSLVEG